MMMCADLFDSLFEYKYLESVFLYEYMYSHGESKHPQPTNVLSLKAG